MTFKNRSRNLSLVYASLLATSFAQVTPVFRTGFETTDSPAYTAAVSNLPFTDATPSVPFYDRNNSGTRTILAENSPFGTGQYLEIGGPNTRVRTSGTIGTLSTFAFDLFEPVGTGGVIQFGFCRDDISTAYLTFTLNNGALSFAAANTERISGTFPTLQVGRLYSVRVMINRGTTSQAVNLPNGATITLAEREGTMLIRDRVSNELLQCGIFRHTPATAIIPNNFMFRTFSTQTNIINLDNCALYSALEATEDPVWDGGGADGLWSSAENWVATQAPAAGSHPTFSGTTNLVTQNDFVAATSFNSLTFSESASGFVINGNSLVLAGPLLHYTTSATNTINTNIDLSATRTINSAGTGELILGGVISGVGGVTKVGSGTVSLTGNNTYTGARNFTAGIVNVSGDQSAADGSLTVGAANSNVSSRLNLLSGGSMAVRSGQTLRIAGATNTGTQSQIFSVNGTFTSASSLAFGRTGLLEIGSGGSWTQNANVTMTGNSTLGPVIEVKDGGIFKYNGTSALTMTSGTGVGGNPKIIVTDSTFETLRGFTTSSTNRPSVTLEDSTLRLTGTIAALSTNVDFILVGISKIDTNTFDGTLGVPLAGASGSLIKAGTGTLTLSVAPAYAGNTTVEAGVLAMTAAGLADSSSVEIKDGAQMALNFSGADKVTSVKLGDTVFTTPGLYNATSHPTFFTGTGSLEIQSAGFAQWASNLGLSGNFAADFDKDGIPDGVEYALAGFDPKAPNATPGTFDGTTLSFAKRPEAVANGDVTYVIQVSSDLGATVPWTTLTPTVNDGTTIAAQLPAGLPSNFARLAVTVPAP
jgi:autotransporter-associated beta strand protein